MSLRQRARLKLAEWIAPNGVADASEAQTPLVQEPATQALPALPEPAHGQNDHAQNAGLARRVEGVAVDPGLYSVLGLPASASDAEIQTAYRQHASRLLSNGSSSDIAELRRLNAAYEVLGTPVRRAEYDQARLLPPSKTLYGPAPPVRPDAKQGLRVTRRRRPRHVVAPREAGLTEVLVVLLVVAFSTIVAALIIPYVSVNLSALNQLSGVLPGSSTRRVVFEPTPTAGPARTSTPAIAATATPSTIGGLAEHFDGSTVTVSSANPSANTPETVLIKLRRDGQPAAGLDVWSTVQYRTTQERWPPTGSVKTDPTGTASITFNVGPATPGYPVEVHVFALVDDQQLSWTTTFTPR